MTPRQRQVADYLARPIAENGWYRLSGEPEATQNAGDYAEHELTVYYEGDDGRFAEESFYLEPNGTGRLSVMRMSHVGHWPPRVLEPLREDYSYDAVGVFDYETTPHGVTVALRVRDQALARDASASFLI